MAWVEAVLGFTSRQGKLFEMISVRKIAALLCFISGLTQAQLPITADLSPLTTETNASVWPVAPPLHAPEGLRPCCAFGYRLKAQVLGIPVPFYRLDNIVQADQLGEHQYNDRMFSALISLAGLSSERNGIIYTSRGGFIDTAHVRDSADMTFFLFSHIWPTLGQEKVIDLSPELAQRHIQFFTFPAMPDKPQRYLLSARLAGYLAFQIAAWHEVAQWYGYESVPGFSEGVSAFSPEDLYSNLLGVRLAMTLILKNHASSIKEFNLAMPLILQQALHQLGAVAPQDTRFHFDMLDGRWWNSHRYLPDKFLVLRRNYLTADDRLPTRVPGETAAPLRLSLPQTVDGFALSSLAELQLWPGKKMQALPAPAHAYYTYRDFPALAQYAQRQDKQAWVVAKATDKEPFGHGR